MTHSKPPVIAVVIPCYNEEAALPETLGVVTSLLEKLRENGKISTQSFLLCVDDGSSDDTWNVISQWNERIPWIKGISLSHNRGHQYALLAGLITAKDMCDAAITLDADLQDDPEAMVEMIEKFVGGAEIVYGVRKSRKGDSWFKRNSARLYYKFQRLMGLETVYDHADYRLMSSRALDILGEYKETNLFLRGIVPQIGLATSTVEYDRKERVLGESKYPLKKMLLFSVDGITSFSARPMRWIFGVGMILIILDIAVGIHVLVSYLRGAVVSGWSSLILSVWFLGSLILMAIGIVGEYIGKIFSEVKGRPRYSIREKIGIWENEK